MNILMSVANEKDALILRACFQNHGCALKEVDSVDDLYCAYVAAHPSIVILDAAMYVAAAEILPSIRAVRAYDEYLSILLLTEKGNVPVLSDSVKLCVDILESPCDEVSTKIRIDYALKSAKIFHKMALAKQRSGTVVENEDFRYEAAKTILEKMANPCRQTFQNIKHFYRPAEGHGGDMLLVERAPDGTQFILLGDVTGHGIAASLAALPITQNYGDVVRKHGMLETVVKELNAIACQHYPVGVFAASAIIELSAVDNTVKIWNGGVPDILVLRNHSNAIERVSSSGTPLGLHSSYAKLFPEVYSLAENDAVYVYTDGLIEAANSHREKYTSERLESCLLKYVDPLVRFDKVYADFISFTEFGKTEDDVTFVEVIPNSGVAA